MPPRLPFFGEDTDVEIPEVVRAMSQTVHISNRVQFQNSLRKAQQMEAIGRLPVASRVRRSSVAVRGQP